MAAMAAYCFCLTASGGVPLFCRTKGDIKPLPFAAIGSLNGVHMFADSQGSQLHSTVTADSKIFWKVFHDSVTLILVRSDDDASDSYMARVLDYIFDCMVLLYGLADLVSIKNVERFKKEIKITFQLIDHFVEKSEKLSFSCLTSTADVIIGQETAILQTYLDAFADAACSPYACLLVGGRVAVATARWWQMAPPELVLLPLLVRALPACASRDLAVFLPVTSPQVPHRLLTFQLISDVEVCVLCGPLPSLTTLQREVERFWRSSIDSLKSICQNHPRNIPPISGLDPNLLAFLLVNVESRRNLSSVCPLSDEGKRKGKTMSQSRRKEVLEGFYKMIVGDVSPALCETADSNEKDAFCDLHSRMSHRAISSYVCTPTHKCYALQAGPYHMFTLYGPAIPTYAMRSVTQKTLDLILKDKTSQV